MMDIKIVSRIMKIVHSAEATTRPKTRASNDRYLENNAILTLYSDKISQKK